MELQPLGCFSGRRTRRRRRRKELGLLLLPPPLLCISPHPHPAPLAAALQVFCARKICCWCWRSQTRHPRPVRVGCVGSTSRSQRQQQEAVGSLPALGKEASGHSQNWKTSSPAFRCREGDRNLGYRDPARCPPPPLMHSLGTLPRPPRSHCSPFSPFSGDRRSGMRV